MRRSHLSRRFDLGALFVGVVMLAGCPGSARHEGTSDTGDADSQTGDGDGDSDEGDDSPQVICVPDDTRCADTGTLEVCAPTGLKWDSLLCGAHETCMACNPEADPECTGARCVGPCELSGEVPASAGCSFFATGMMINVNATEDNLAEPDALIVANPNEVGDATVNVLLAPIGSNKEEMVEGPITLAPGETHVIKYTENLTDFHGAGTGTSKYQSGGVYHVVSDLPIIAYLHTPLKSSGTNEASLLLPESALAQDYVIYNYTPYAEPGYFVVVAVENQTTVRWRPTIETAGNNLPLPFVEVGQEGEYKLNRLDTMRIAASANLDAPECRQDLSGTIVESDKPIMVISAVVGVRVPYCNSTGCTESPQPDEPTPVEGCTPADGPYAADFACCNSTDHIQEVNIPLAYWGKTYVGAHAPVREDEPHFWRVFAGEDDTTITVTPAQLGTPIHLAKRGDWVELELDSGVSVVFEGDKPFMPVQFTARRDLAGHMGDAAMTQSVPVEQWLSRYAFVTGIDYTQHYAQIIRATGSAPVLLDGEPVEGFYAIGDYEVADVLISEGAHVVVSDDPFGIEQFGYRGGGVDFSASAYAYPGGLKTEPLFIP
ncbi:MAG: IgGFc-binding protein [Enhygromyxa sp.]